MKPLVVTFNDGTQQVNLTFSEKGIETKIEIEFRPPKNNDDDTSEAENWAARYIEFLAS